LHIDAQVRELRHETLHVPKSGSAIYWARPSTALIAIRAVRPVTANPVVAYFAARPASPRLISLLVPKTAVKPAAIQQSSVTAPRMIAQLSVKAEEIVMLAPLHPLPRQ
jgi:hypothetical protein